MGAKRNFEDPFFQQAKEREWCDWRWQLRNRIRDLQGLERVLELSDSERQAIQRRTDTLPVGITPYYLALMDADNLQDPLRRTMVPTLNEFHVMPYERVDPLGEEAHSPVPGLVHTYPGKVLFLVTEFCATYCRYCTRSRLVGSSEFLPDRATWENAICYIEQHPNVHDVLLSGGDPLILSDQRLSWLLERLHAIPHVELIRIGSKLPAVLPYRITNKFVDMLRQYHPLWMSIHFTHPNELTDEVGEACARLANAGVPLMSQTVLLSNVNDDVDTLRDLFRGQLRFRVKPYYLHQCDAVAGSSHFKTTVDEGRKLMGQLHGHLTGYAVPTYMIDAPGGGGKVPVSDSAIVGRDGDDVVLRNYMGSLHRYPDPGPSSAHP